ncbi:MAG: Rieske 2Fe-2S domain-containing protein [Trueperaceae bacterium]|nr:MAG: Rieske 2Fe-2S domain-containing protein [Trueperaceae bacterium]
MHEARRRLLTWLWRIPVVAALGGAGYGGYEAYRVHFSKRRPNPKPVFQTRSRERVADLSELTESWAAVPFLFADLPAIVLRLPGPIAGGLTHQGAHYAAFSRICTHQHCLVDLSRDPSAIALAFNYRSEVPALVCACHLSVFAPDRGGRAVSGPAVLPLPRVELQQEAGVLYATGIEVS